MSGHGGFHEALKDIFDGDNDEGKKRPGGFHEVLKDIFDGGSDEERKKAKDCMEREKKERERCEREEREKRERDHLVRERREKERKEHERREREKEEKRRKLEEEWKAKSPLAKRFYVLFDAPCDFSSQEGEEFHEGSKYRVHNSESLSCLSSTSVVTSTETAAVGSSPRDIRLEPTALPGILEELEQVWTISRPDNDPNEHGENSSKQSNSYILESNAHSVEHKKSGELSHAFRIDLKEIPVVPVEGKVPNVAENPINGLSPKFPIGPRELPPAPPPPAFEQPPTVVAPTAVSVAGSDIFPSPPLSVQALKPELELETIRTVVVSPLGNQTSEWIFLLTWETCQYLVVNKVTKKFLVQSSSGTVVAADLKTYRRSLHEWVKAVRATESPKTEKKLDIDDQLADEWRKWLWKVEPWDNGPSSGFYRIVHSLVPIALHPSPKKSIENVTGSATSEDSLLAISTVDPSASNQIWSISTSTTPTRVMYTTFNYAPNQSNPSEFPLSKGQLRFIKVPKTPIQLDDFFKIYNPATRSVLAISTQCTTAARVVWKIVPHTSKEDDETVLHRVYHMTDIAEVMWRFHDEKWAPEDGLYNISQSPHKFLDIPAQPVGDPLQIPLQPQNAVTPETQWWRVKSYIDQVGIIYQEITNYRSGHTVNVTAAGGADGKVNGQRLGIVTENDWKFSSGDPTNQVTFTIESVHTKHHFLWGTVEAELQKSVVPNAFQWTLTKVDTIISSGKTYYLVNLGTNLLLSTNGAMSLNKPLTVVSESGPAQRWQPKRVGKGLDFVLYSNTSPLAGTPGRYFAATPPIESDWVPENGIGMEFPIEAAEDKRIGSITSWKPVKSGADIEGYALITSGSKSMGVREVGDREWSVIIGSEADTTTDPSMFFRWRFIEFGADAPSPASVKHLPTKSSYVPDGMYRIVSRQKRLALSLNEQDVIKRRNSGAEHPLSLGLAVSVSEENYYDIWYIQRKRSEKLNPQLTSSEKAIYTIRSCATALFLDTGDAAARQRYEGVSSWVTPKQDIYRTQQWRIIKQSALGWAIESRSIGGILDSSGQVLTTNPLLTAVPNKLQIWQLDPVTCSLSSGAFFIRNLYTGCSVGIRPRTANRSDGPSDVVSGEREYFKPTQLQWRLTGQPGGLYLIESLQHLQFVSSDDEAPGGLAFTNAVEGQRSYWQLWPNIHGSFMLQNAYSKTFAAVKKGLAVDGARISMQDQAGERDLPWQLFQMERIESPSRSFDDLPSDKILPAVYRIQNVASGNFLAFASSPQLYHAASCVPDSSSVNSEVLWNVKASGAGYYAFHNSGGYTLGQQWSTAGEVIALHGFFDTTRWKLLNFDSDHWRVVNKDTGLVLTSGVVTASGFDNNVTAVVDRGPALSQRWRLVREKMPPKTSVGDFTKLARELRIPNGLYNLANIKQKDLLVISDSGTVGLEPKILDPLSPDIPTQVWIISAASDGWFHLRSFIYGSYLGLTQARNFVSMKEITNTDPTFHWKFIQDVIGTDIALVNRNVLSENLGITDKKPSIYKRKDDDLNQRWKVVTQTGSGQHLRLPSGVYAISSYTSPNLLDTVGRTQTITTAIQERTEIEASARAALNLVADRMELFFESSPPLPDGVDMEAALGVIKDEDDSYVDEVIKTTTTLISTLYKDTLAKKDQSRREKNLFETSQNIGDALAKFAKEYPANQRDGPIGAILDATATIITTELGKTKLFNLIEPPPPPPATKPSPSTGVPAARELVDVETPPKAHVTDEELQSALVRMTMTVVSRFKTTISKLNINVEAVTRPAEPSRAITKEGDNVITNSPMSHNEKQLWHLEGNEDGTHFISHLTSREYLTYDASQGVATLVSATANAKTWRVMTLRGGGRAIWTNEDQPRALSLPSEDAQEWFLLLKADPKGSTQPWSLTRSGYYIQNQDVGQTHQVLSARNDRQVVLSPYRPFSQSRSMDGARADAYQIWHLIKDSKEGDAPIWRFINEFSRTTLGYRNEVPYVNEASPRNDDDSWKIAKDGDQVWLLSNGGKMFLQKKKAGDTAEIGLSKEHGNKEPWRGWQMLAVSAADRSDFMMLPRCALLRSSNADQSSVCDFTPPLGADLVPYKPYKPDNSYQRFRVLKFGKLTAFLNEATRKCLSHTHDAVPLEKVDSQCWFTVEGNQAKVETKNQYEIVTTTGDLPATKNVFRVQIGKGIQQTPLVIGVNSSDGSVRTVEYNPHDGSQTWRQLEWQKGRFITHMATGKLLASTDDGSLILSNSYSSRAMWWLNSSSGSTIGDGFFPLSNGDLTLNILPDSGLRAIKGFSPYGCRFITESSSYTLTHRSIILKKFLETRGPVFVHPSGTPLPTDEAEFPDEIKSLHPFSEAFIKSPKVYVIVRQSTEPIYLNYTDVSYCLWYKPTHDGDMTRGWRFITVRYSNMTNALESVYFPNTSGQDLGWVYNIDLNFSVMAKPDHNRLKVLKRSDPISTKLHVYVGPDLVIRPDFPNAMTNADIVDPSKWPQGLSLDSGDKDVASVIEAEMLVDDQSGSKPIRPAWVESETPWTAGGAGKFMPVGILNGM